jgi:excisionase family DNA binding protein
VPARPISTREVAEAAGVSRATLYRWVERGLLPAPVRKVAGRHGGREHRWPRGTLERASFIRQCLELGYSLDEIPAENALPEEP